MSNTLSNLPTEILGRILPLCAEAKFHHGDDILCWTFRMPNGYSVTAEKLTYHGETWELGFHTRCTWGCTPLGLRGILFRKYDLDVMLACFAVAGLPQAPWDPPEEEVPKADPPEVEKVIPVIPEEED